MVAVGLTILTTVLYVIGDNQNLFGSTIKIHADFTNVNGLTTGNNVRYVGIDVGTVSNIEIINDSLVRVEMTIESEAKEFIRTNAIANIGTDGLMGNKLVSINAVPGNSPYIKDGVEIKTIAPLDTDAIMRTLSQTNTEMYTIAYNLRSITEKIDGENMVWNLLGDSVIGNNIRSTMKNVDKSSEELKYLITSLREMSGDIERGEGLMGTLLHDTVIMQRVDKTMRNLQVVSDSLGHLTNDIARITEHVKGGKGAAGTILMDEKFDQNLNETIENMKKASKSLEENMEALKHNFLFRRYFKNQKKEDE